MGKGASRNKKCSCGSGLKQKYCKCGKNEKVDIDELFPNKNIKFEGGMLHILGAVSNSQYPDLGPIGSDKWWYTPFCTQAQIDVIFSPKSAYDILLKKQVDSVLDNMRINRLMYKRYNESKDWDIKKQFNREIFDLFFEIIRDKGEYKVCKSIPCGTTYDSDANGQCMRTQFGNIITISESLRHFLYFINLFFYGIRDENIPFGVTMSSLRIAIRVMLNSESLDFEMDPRGEIPAEIDRFLQYQTNWQLLFVIGHEFSHSLLGHLDDSNIIRRIHGMEEEVIFNQNQLQELEADINSITLISGKAKKSNVILASISFFLALDLFEQAKEQISPSMERVKSHPQAIDRINNICRAFEHDINKQEVEVAIQINEKFKKILEDDISCNFDDFESYGSVYLDEWHKKMLVDRVDY